MVNFHSHYGLWFTTRHGSSSSLYCYYRLTSPASLQLRSVKVQTSSIMWRLQNLVSVSWNIMVKYLLELTDCELFLLTNSPFLCCFPPSKVVISSVEQHNSFFSVCLMSSWSSNRRYFLFKPFSAVLFPCVSRALKLDIQGPEWGSGGFRCPWENSSKSLNEKMASTGDFELIPDSVILSVTLWPCTIYHLISIKYFTIPKTFFFFFVRLESLTSLFVYPLHYYCGCCCVALVALL